MAREFSSFVAWRYLLARPRQASGAILGACALGIFVGLAGALAGLVYPMSEPYVLGPTLPPTLLVIACLGAAAVPVAAVAGLIHAVAFSAPRRLAPGFLHSAAMGLLLAAAPLTARERIEFEGGALLSYLRESEALIYFAPGAAAGLFFLAAAVIASLRSLSLTYRAPGARALYAMGWGLALVQLLPLAALGVREQVVPELSAREPALLWSGAAATAALLVVAGALALRRLAGRGGAAGPRGVLLLALAAAAMPVGATWLFEGQSAWQEAAGFGLQQPPMWMTMPTTIAWAIAGLAFVLAHVRYIFSFFTTVSIGGVCLGAMALVIVLSVMSGFETDLRDKILGADAHILVTKRGDEPFTEYRELGERIEGVEGVKAQSPFLETEVVISSRNSYGNVIIKGIDPEGIDDVTDLDKNTRDPDAVARLWPLEEDGSLAGPPEAAERGDPSAAPGDAPEPPAPGAPDEPAADEPRVDPAPDDLDVDIGDPDDFSAPPAPGESGRPDGGDRDEGEGEPGAEPGADDPAPVDPAPGDLDVDIDDPADFSAPAESGDGASGDGARGGGVEAAEAGEESGPAPWPGAGDAPGPPGEGASPLGGGPLEDPLRDPLGDPLGGVDPDAIVEPEAIAPEVAELPGVLVGRELVEQVPMQEGDEITIISPLGQDSPVGPVPRTKRYRVAGEFFTGMYEIDLKYAYTPLYSLQDFLDLGDEITGIEIRIDDPDRSDIVAEEIEGAVGDDYRVADWRELNRSLFSALQLEKIAMFIVLAIIILVASFSIVGNLVMIVIEKSREIALLKTLGATDTGVMKVFVVQGFFIGLVGTILGVALGLIVCALGMMYGLPLDPDVYYIDQLPIHVEPSSVVIVAVAGVLISVLATLYPAYVAARVRPVEGLRNE